MSLKIQTDWVLGRLGETSTLRGIIGVIAGVAGITLAPNVENAIVAVGMAVIGLINVIRKEKPSSITNTTAPVVVTGGATVESKT